MVLRSCGIGSFLVLLCAAAACSSSPAAAPSAALPDAATHQTTGDDGAAPQDAGDQDAGDEASVAACPPGPSTGDFPRDVGAVIAAKCQACHRSPPRNHAPFALLNYEDTRGADPVSPYAGQPIWQVMHIVIQPAGVPHMPLGNAPQLTPQEFRTLDGWLTTCATPVTEGTGSDADSAGNTDAAPAGSGDAATE